MCNERPSWYKIGKSELEEDHYTISKSSCKIQSRSKVSSTLFIIDKSKILFSKSLFFLRVTKMISNRLADVRLWMGAIFSANCILQPVVNYLALAIWIMWNDTRCFGIGILMVEQLGWVTTQQETLTLICLNSSQPLC